MNSDGGLVMHREIGRRTGAAMSQLGAERSSRGRPRSVADRKTEMCSIFDVYDKMCSQRCV